ncbi:MAG: bifunctional sulfate adenylyltransferase/adenylylsulfate kinase [Fimbriimonas ginsengisoli]|nr:bifunctional sulfate adenylyltransferase/adenylylsulfate kinase [Fimbriimonas ginsengisoli]
MTQATASLIAPYGGRLVDLFASESERKALFERAKGLPYVQLSPRSQCDFELLATGGFSPLTGFMPKADYDSVLDRMRLADGTVFPIPITLPVEPGSVEVGKETALRGLQNELLGVMHVEEIFEWHLEREALAVAGTLDDHHPLVAEMRRWPKAYAAGPVKALQLPGHKDFPEIRRTPAQVRALLSEKGQSRVVAFQTRNPLHRAHEELTKRAMREIDGALLLHPTVGVTKPGDVDHFTRMRTYKALVDHHYEPTRTVLSLLPLAMRMAGPREAVWHAIIRRNFGASHFIVGRDHASPGVDSTGKPFYGPYDAQELMRKLADELGIEMLAFAEMVYLEGEDRYEASDALPTGAKTLSISGTQVRTEYLSVGRLLPEWFTRPEVARILAQAYPPLNQQGFCVWFTGLPSSGKSTIAEVLAVFLMEKGRQVTMLDGDVVRTHLSKGLGFSKEDRDTNILRIGFVASEVAKHGGAVIAAAVSPYEATRQQVRNMVGPERFVEVFVDTPLGVCEQRDLKGLYAKARRGEAKGVTGIDDPYEAPSNPALTLTTTECNPAENARKIADFLEAQKFL